MFEFAAENGNILSIDNRNESCSLVNANDDVPTAYRLSRARHVVKDLEVLRRSLYGTNRQWRIFGQSRGGPISHYYLEMSPDKTLQYSLMRSLFNARATGLFAEKSPEAADVIRKTKTLFAQKNFACQ